MALAGYEIIMTKPGELEEWQCRVCGTTAEVQRNLHGPTSWASAMAQKHTDHDMFACPHREKDWHEKALRLAVAIDETPSESVAEMMKKDLESIIKNNT